MSDDISKHPAYLTLAAENATLRAERDAAQAGWDDQKARHKGCFSSMWKNLLRALDAEQERDTLRASEAAALERVKVLETAGDILAADASRFHSALWSDAKSALTHTEGN